MARFNLNKLRSAGLRYIAADADGQMWAFESIPVRSGTHWRLQDEHLCPIEYDENYLEYWRKVTYWRNRGRELCMPIYDAPIALMFDDDPYDILVCGLVAVEEFNVWPAFQ